MVESIAAGNQLHTELVRGGDPHAAVRQALIKLDPGRFGRISKDTFVVQSQGRLGLGSVFWDPSFDGAGMLSLLNGRVHVDDEMIGDIVPNTLLTQLSRFYHKIDDEHKFLCTSIFNKTTGSYEIVVEGQGTGADRTRVILFNLPVKPQGTFRLEGIAKNVSAKDASFLFNAVMQKGVQHFEQHVGSGAAAAVFVNVTINNTVIVEGGADGVTDPDKLTDFDIIRMKVEDDAKRQGLRKRDGLIYEPVLGCPCAFLARCTYEKHITTVLRGDANFKSNPRRFDEMLKYFKNYDEDELPFMEPDRDILSFLNGVVHLAANTFTPYEGMGVGLTRGVARHHIPQMYTGNTNTPLLDRILDAQFSKEVADVLLALIGRCFFAVGLLDQWQVMPFLVGVGGTGKSLILTIISSMFAKGAVGNLAAKREEVFGMANLVDKEVIIGREMPAKMSACLPQALMQTMTAGEEMEIPRKGENALQVQWTAPLVFAGNHQPDYTNTGNCVGRRMVSFRFDNAVDTKDQDLLRNILFNELQNIICRSLNAYSQMRALVKERGDFWKAVPPIMIEWKDGLAAATNKLEEFLRADDDDRKCSIIMVPGCVTFQAAFKTAFSAVFPNVKCELDAAVLAAFGFSLSTTASRVQKCKSCSRPSLAGCCALYSLNNRSLKPVINNMQLRMLAA